MLRNRSRTVTTKNPIMADHQTTSLPSPTTQTHTRPISSFFGSPRFFNGFLSKGISDIETVMSPTSILDTKHFNFVNPFAHDKTLSKPTNTFPGNKHPLYKKFDSEGIGLALIDSLIDENTNEDASKPLRSKLKIQIPAISSPDSPKSPGDFGIKTRNSSGSVSFGVQINDSPMNLCLSEIEHSEEYTCVISHGPNPRTTHIYDNCIVGVAGLSELKSPSQNLANNCMYRDEKALCSHECRCQEMLFDEMKNLELDGVYRTAS